MGTHTYSVYIMASLNRTLYIGITNNLETRVWQHRHVGGSRFAAKYRAHRLVYHEEYASPSDAIAREKQLKRWRRSKKLWLIDSVNPAWEDLIPDPGVAPFPRDARG